MPRLEVAGARRVYRHPRLVGGAQKRSIGAAQQLLPFTNVTAQTPVQLGRRHPFLELPGLQHFRDEIVGLEKDVLVEDDVVDADDAVTAQRDVVHQWRDPVQGETERPMDVVVEVGARGDDPVDEARLHEGNECGVAESRRGQSPADREADGDVGGEHLVGKDVAGFPQTPAL